MIEILYDARHTARPVVSYSLLAICVLVTVPSLFAPSLYEVFGGAGPHDQPWQVVTSVFEHGFVEFGFAGGFLHLALNVYLILECGRPCERLLGSARFALVSLVALAANAAAQLLTGGVSGTEGVQGASLVIWAWGASLFIALLHARRSNPSTRFQPEFSRLRRTLILMYVVIPLLTPILPFSAGWDGPYLHALVLGNLYHMVATAVGLGFAAHWFLEIRQRLEDIAFVVKAKETPLRR